MKMKPTPRPPSPRVAPRRIPPRRKLQARAASNPKEVEDYEEEYEPSMKLWQAFFVVFLLHVLAVGGIFAFNSLKSGREKPVAAKPAATKTAEPAKAEAPVAAVPSSPAAPAVDAKTHTVVAGETLSRIASQHGTSVRLLEEANGLASGATIRVGQVLKIPAEPVANARPALQPATAPKVPATAPSTPAPKPVMAKTEAKPATATAKPAVAKTETQAASSPKPAAQADATAKPAAAPAGASGDVYVVAKGDNPYSIAKKLKVSYSDLLKKNNIEDPTKLQIGQKLIIP